MNVKKPAVNFINVLFENFHTKFWRQKLQSWNVGFVIFWRQNIGEKRTRKTLTKLPPGYHVVFEWPLSCCNWWTHFRHHALFYSRRVLEQILLLFSENQKIAGTRMTRLISRRSILKKDENRIISYRMLVETFHIASERI